MVYETTTSLPPAEVLDRAERFFGERVPLTAAFPEQRGPGHLVLRGQGGEEVAIAVREVADGTHVRGSSLLFDQPLDRFLTTLPPAETTP